MKFYKDLKKDRIVFAVLGIIGAYFLIAPTIPNVLFYIQRALDYQRFFGKVSLVFETGETKSSELLSQQTEVLGTSSFEDSNMRLNVLEGKKLKIDSIDLNTTIYQGDNSNTLSKGAWLKPNGKKPGEGGKVIITAHRFQYFGKDKTFYHLDKVGEGDKIIVIWDGNIHEYEVKNIQIVNERSVWIENQEGKEELLLYTCQGIDASTRIAINAEYISSQILTRR